MAVNHHRKTSRVIGMLLVIASYMVIMAWPAYGQHTEGFTKFVGYGDLLTLDEPSESGFDVSGRFFVKGTACFHDVAVFVKPLNGLGDSVCTYLEADSYGRFSSDIWIPRGPGKYVISVACRRPANEVYTTVVHFTVRNTLSSIPLCPEQYKGYGRELRIDSPYAECNVVFDSLTVRGWASSSTLWAWVQNAASGKYRVREFEVGPDGRFGVTVPLDVGDGDCIVKLASEMSGPNTWHVAAVYRVVVRSPLTMVQPAYREGLLSVYDRFVIRGIAHASGCRVDVVQGGVRKTVAVSPQSGPFEVWLNPPAPGEEYQLECGLPDPLAGEYRVLRRYRVVRADPLDRLSEKEEREIQWNSAEIVKLASSITRGVSGDYAKLRAIHRWVSENIAYDVGSWQTGAYVSMDVDAITTLRRRGSVCRGYSNLIAALAKASGIDGRVVSGQSVARGAQNSHAWNEFMVDGRIVLVDATWDAGYVSGAVFMRRPDDRWFDASPEDFYAVRQRS